MPHTTSVDIHSEMRKLIDHQQYRKALEIFDQHSARFTDSSLNLALKASTKLSDRTRGIRIHRQLSKQALEDTFIQTSLLHFYSKCHSLSFTNQILDH